MMLVNDVSRFQVASRALKASAGLCDAICGKLDDFLDKIDEQREHVEKYIMENGKGLSTQLLYAESMLILLKTPDDIYKLKL